MFEIFRHRPSAAMVVATLALIVALAGSSYAAFTLPKNSVGTQQIKDSAVTNWKLSNGSVGPAKIKNGAVTGPKMNFSGVTVPNARHANTADNASHAGDAANVGGIAAAELSCPAGTIALAGSCFETTERAAANWFTAVRICAEAGRHLPSAAQLAGIRRAGLLSWNLAEMSSDVFVSSEPGLPKYMNVDAFGGLGSYSISLPSPYRCVTNPTP